MLLPKDIHPNNCLYFNGAYILKFLRKHDSLEMFDLFLGAKEELSALTMPVFVLTLDWLFLVGAIDLDSKGNISICF